MPELFETLENIAELQAVSAEMPGAVVYFSTTACNVCKVLKPKVMSLFAADFPQLRRCFVDCDATPEISAQLSIFTVPTVVVFLDGREFLRESRHFSVELLGAQVARPYEMMCNE